MAQHLDDGPGPRRPGRRWTAAARGVHERDTFLVTALGAAVRELAAEAVFVHLLEAGGETLRLTMAGGLPPAIVVMPERIAATDAHPTANALRSGTPVMAPQQRPTAGAAQLPGVVPILALVVAAPLTHDGRRLGALTGIWTQDSAATPESRAERLEAIARDLSGRLATMAGQGVPMSPGTKPVIVPVLHPARTAADRAAGGTGASRWGMPEIPGSTEVTFMYHIHQLAAMLNEAGGFTEVMEVVQERIMEPFGAAAFLVTSVEYGKVWVAGYGNCPQEAVKRLHGSSAHHDGDPLREVMRSHVPLCYRDRAALVNAYPGTEDGRRVEDGVQGGWVYLPIMVGSLAVGACALGFEGPVNPTAQEQIVLLMMANLLGPTLVRARLSQSGRSLAERVQNKLLPETAWDIPGLALAARYVPSGASALGGDWYDVMLRDESTVGLVVGDVEGHSIDSSVVMAQLRTAVRAYFMEGHPPATVLRRTDRLLSQLDTDLLATCCVAALDLGDGTLDAASAGHPAPVVRHPDGSVTVPDLRTGPPLGVDPHTVYASAELSLPPATLLMLHTNGLSWTSAADAATPESLLASLGAHGDTRPERLVDLVLAAGPQDRARRDDVALLMARYEGGPTGSGRHTGRLSVQRHDLQAVRASRTFVRDLLHAWHLDEHTEDVALMTSEVVTNALVHADSGVDIRMRVHGKHLRVEVRDSDPTPPVPEPIVLSNQPGSEWEHGRGLIIVDALAADWGTAPSGHGKTVWFERSIRRAPTPPGA
ncbi:SpoIIE family protein phosphatase [Streptomyces sp. NPDC056716]|uniref:SpoIIE family protein phosphatase n=1 Tax=unclassified Streptomyces TaxID=2593676 RepID=UPI003690D634